MQAYRPLLISWLYLISVLHVILGVVFTVLSESSPFEYYHWIILHSFWVEPVPAVAKDLQVWWLSLFGATLQALGILMLLVVYAGHRFRLAGIWLCMFLAFAVWAPQDMYFSAQRQVWVHLWVDAGSLLVLVPPLLMLWNIDKSAQRNIVDLAEKIQFSKKSKSVLVTGGTGFIGKLLVNALLADGQRVTLLTRNPKETALLFDGRFSCISDMKQLPQNFPVDVIINLAGARILGWRWTPARQQTLRDSRIKLTQNIVNWIATAECKPALFLTASAIGYYGIQKIGDDTELTEASCSQSIFMASLCREWEDTAQAGSQYGVSVVAMRFGLVLGHGGALPTMLLPIKLGMGGALGLGKQWVSWIHVADLLRGIAHLWQMNEAGKSLQAAYNFTAPETLHQIDFSETAAALLHRPFVIPTPARPMRLLLGEQADLLLEGQRVVPTNLLAEKFEFRYPTLEAALRNLL